MQEYMKMLGRKGRDCVTGFSGVVASVSFDLYGCVQVVLTPAVEVDGKLGESHWFDAKRIEIIDNKPVISVPSFSTQRAGDEIGPTVKPPMNTHIR
jgi:hypothetical protein